MHSKSKLKKAPARWSFPLPSGAPPCGEELLHFLDPSFDPLCIAGFDGMFKHLNPAWQHVLGWSPAEMTKLATGAVTINFENRYQCDDGAWKWLQWTAKHSPVSRSIYAILAAVVLLRFGLLTLISAAVTSTISLFVLPAILGYAFVVSLSVRPIFQRSILPE